MARIELAPEVAGDLERILNHLVAHRTPEAAKRVADLLDAISILETAPGIGRPIGKDKRELVVGARSQRYLVQYRYVPGV
ncbi:MAG TPA: type II toxin-antitoxin system RelE/ParE family toxin, partial [Telluria sp.]|nr:type II toxin-antitoxin system RelE/ParE family toxin [Telluria sp.]